MEGEAEVSINAVTITGEHLEAWQFFCGPIEVHPCVVVWGVDETSEYRFGFRCPECGQVHTPAIYEVVEVMERVWRKEQRDGQPRRAA